MSASTGFLPPNNIHENEGHRENRVWMKSSWGWSDNLVSPDPVLLPPRSVLLLASTKGKMFPLLWLVEESTFNLGLL